MKQTEHRKHKTRWLEKRDLMDLAEISDTAAKNALSKGFRGESWRGAQIKVVKGKSRGGIGYQVQLESLPIDLQLKYFEATDPRRHPTQNKPRKRELTSKASIPEIRESLSKRWEDAKPSSQNAALKRLSAVRASRRLVESGIPKTKAVEETAKAHEISVATLYNHLKRVDGIPEDVWHAALLRQDEAGSSRSEFSPEAWELIKADYLRLEAPALSACIHRARRKSEREKLGWKIPSDKTVARWIEKKIFETERVLARQGPEALQRIYPAQERDHAFYAPGEAVNADGHTFDVFVRWEDGTIGRPVLVAFQDIHSGKILGYRVDRSENCDVIRLAFGDTIEQIGIPKHAFLDNGRGFASKWMTGGTSTRFRFKVKPQDPSGIMQMMGITVHWCTPYHGQAKPIERAFRDLSEYIAIHPACKGAYTGRNPNAKPENYGSKAVDIAKFMHVLHEEIADHNARGGRRSRVCQGKKSFDEVFRDGHAQRRSNGLVRMPTDAQRRLWLLTSEAVRASRENGEIKYADNRYWSESLVEFRGQRLVLRFDPESLHDTAWVYTLQGRFIGPADCIRAAGFGDTSAAREHNRARKQFARATKQKLEAQRRMDRLKGLIPDPASTPTPAEITKHPTTHQQSDTEPDFDMDAAFSAASKRLAAGMD